MVTSSDVLYLYDLQKDENHPEQPLKIVNTIPFRNEHEYSNPISSFDWNRCDPSKIAVSSVDSTVTILDINRQCLTTQIIAHDKAVYDVSFAPNESMFASCGEDGSVRIFDINNLEKSNIIHESNGVPLIRISWDVNDRNLLALITEENSSVLLLDIRKANQFVGELKQEKPVIGLAWNAK